MNKKHFNFFVAVAMMLMCAGTANAQLKFGVKAGLNMTKVNLDKDVKSIASANKDNTTGFFAGVTADVTIPLAGLGADIAVLYDQKKVETEDETKKLEYITVPINAKYTLGFSSLLSVYAATGPQFSFNVSGKNWDERINGIGSEYSLKSSEFSWNVGAGATVLKHVRVGYNYNIALGNTADVSVSQVGLDAYKGKLKNNTHQVSVTYIF